MRTNRIDQGSSRRAGPYRGAVFAAIAALMLAGAGAAGLALHAPRPADLSRWRNTNVIVHLRQASHPATADTGRTTQGVRGIMLLHGVHPINVQGTLSDVSSDAVVISSADGDVWVPRDSILAVEAAPSK